MTLATLTFHASSYAPGVLHRPHAHDELHLSMLVRGSVAETVNGQTVKGRTLSVVSKDPGVVHTDTFGRDGALIARLSIPHRCLATLGDHPTREQHWQWCHDVTVAAAFLRIVQRQCERPTTVSVDDDDLVDVLAGLSSPSVTSRAKTARAGNPPAWLRDVMTFIWSEWTPALSASDVALRAGVHPVYLARCLRQWYGLTASEALRDMRLAMATNALATSRHSVSSIAQYSGFSDEPHLSRSLRRRLAVSPREYRRVVARLDAALAARDADSSAEPRSQMS